MPCVHACICPSTIFCIPCLPWDPSSKSKVSKRKQCCGQKLVKCKYFSPRHVLWNSIFLADMSSTRSDIASNAICTIHLCSQVRVKQFSIFLFRCTFLILWCKGKNAVSVLFVNNVNTVVLAAMSSPRSDSVINAIHASVCGHSCFWLSKGVYMALIM